MIDPTFPASTLFTSWYYRFIIDPTLSPSRLFSSWYRCYYGSNVFAKYSNLDCYRCYYRHNVCTKYTLHILISVGIYYIHVSGKYTLHIVNIIGLLKTQGFHHVHFSHLDYYRWYYKPKVFTNYSLLNVTVIGVIIEPSLSPRTLFSSWLY